MFKLMFHCSSLKLVYIFSVNPHLGPLQVSLSRMVMDIMKFFFLYVLVLFAFSCGNARRYYKNNNVAAIKRGKIALRSI